MDVYGKLIAADVWEAARERGLAAQVDIAISQAKLYPSTMTLPNGAIIIEAEAVQAFQICRQPLLEERLKESQPRGYATTNFVEHRIFCPAGPAGGLAVFDLVAWNSYCPPQHDPEIFFELHRLPHTQPRDLEVCFRRRFDIMVAKTLKQAMEQTFGPERRFGTDEEGYVALKGEVQQTSTARFSIRIDGRTATYRTWVKLCYRFLSLSPICPLREVIIKQG